MPFDAYARSLDLTRSLVPTLKHLATHDPDLAKQLRRALQSVTNNIAEANGRAGKDRRHLFRIAYASAAEVGGCIDGAHAFGYLDDASVAEPLALADRVRAMTYRLANG
jgi:four helix bundle protein